MNTNWVIFDNYNRRATLANLDSYGIREGIDYRIINPGTDIANGFDSSKQSVLMFFKPELALAAKVLL